MIHVSVVNHSTVVNDGTVARWAEIVGRQIKRDFGPIWNIDAEVEFATVAPKDGWKVVVADDSDQVGALGYHEDTLSHIPVAFVFAADDLRDGMLPSVTLSHEVIEMLVDPFIDRVWHAHGADWIMEAADPVQADQDGYDMDNSGTIVSDFVTPNWGVPGSAGPWDFRKLTRKPFEIRPGGYISVRENGEPWKQIFGQLIPGAPAFRTRVHNGRVAHIHFHGK